MLLLLARLCLTDNIKFIKKHIRNISKTSGLSRKITKETLFRGNTIKYNIHFINTPRSPMRRFPEIIYELRLHIST